MEIASLFAGSIIKGISQLFYDLWYLIALVIIAVLLKMFSPVIKGFFGEKSVAFFLSRLDPTKYKIINNIMLQKDSVTTQIDHVVVSNFGIFVVETKNYKGWILGNEYDDYWTQVIYKRKERLYNPLKQNYGHVQALKEILLDYSDVNYVPIVAFTTKATLKVKTNSQVIYTVNLLKAIRKYKTETIPDSNKERIYLKLLSLNVDSKETRKSHAVAIHSKLSDKSNILNNNICPKCGGNLVLRNGKYGQFTGCSNYPKCRYILNKIV